MKIWWAGLKVFFAIGYRVAQASKFPEWKPGNEFKAIREAMLRQYVVCRLCEDVPRRHGEHEEIFDLRVLRAPWFVKPRRLALQHVCPERNEPPRAGGRGSTIDFGMRDQLADEQMHLHSAASQEV